MTAAFVGPTSMGLILVAGPVIRLFYGQQWSGAIPLMQILTVGSLINASAWPLPAALTAAGRLADYARAWTYASILFVILVPGGCYLAGVNGTAAAVSIWQVCSSCIVAAIFIRGRSGLLLPFIWSGPSIAASALAAILAIFICRIVEHLSSTRFSDGATMTLLLVPYVLIVMPLMVMFDRRSTVRIVGLLRPKLTQFRLLFA